MSGQEDIDLITSRLSQASVKENEVLSFAGKGFKLDNAVDGER